MTQAVAVNSVRTSCDDGPNAGKCGELSAGERITLFDTTLRDGAQTYGVDLSLSDKLRIAQQLDRLGIDYIEAGWPGANPVDDAFFKHPPQMTKARITAFGMTARAGDTELLDKVLQVQAEAVCLVGKSWNLHVRQALRLTEDENLQAIANSVAAAAASGKEVLFDAEHFFDGYKADPDYALSCVLAAYRAGARWLVLCDTNGGTLPDEVTRVVTEVTGKIPGGYLGIHSHNDADLATANTLAALQAGARMVQGTINGLGERCGNANLVSLIPTLTLKLGYTTGLERERLPALRDLSLSLDLQLDRISNPQAPYVGENAFAHKGGLHASGVLRNPLLYEHVRPESVGNRRLIVVSNQAGRTNVLLELQKMGLADCNRGAIDALVKQVKERDLRGYAYDCAGASFELLVRKQLGILKSYFELLRFSVIDEHRHDAHGQLSVHSEATVKIRIGERQVHTIADGNGPVNALDRAVRKALESFYPCLCEMRLVDYRVRILRARAGTAAVTRVLIESSDSRNSRWTTIGVSSNIIGASCEALIDSFVYRLLSSAVETQVNEHLLTSGNESHQFEQTTSAA